MKTSAGNRKFGIASLIAGGAVSAGEWNIALGVYVVYVMSNLLEKLSPWNGESD